jgi:hypothetical protein
MQATVGDAGMHRGRGARKPATKGSSPRRRQPAGPSPWPGVELVDAGEKDEPLANGRTSLETRMQWNIPGNALVRVTRGPVEGDGERQEPGELCLVVPRRSRAEPLDQ